jgi:hypothetical protein
MPYRAFDRSRLKLKPLAGRVHDLSLDHWLALDDPAEPFDHPDLPTVAARILTARRRGAAVILLMGGHVIRAGVARHLVDLLERGLISHLAMNGAAAIHDYELALVGATTESVARYIREGQFGLWVETGRMNDVIVAGVRDGLGMGEALGRAVEEGRFPQRALSVLAACYRLRVPATVHVGIGYDIIHEHPNCDGAALGAASYQDFLILAQTILGTATPPLSPRGAAECVAMTPGCAAPRGERSGVRGYGLEGGVVLNFGTAVMGPEVLLKALAMARNVAQQEAREIAHFTSAVFDLLPLSGDLRHEARKGTPEYYFRPYKTLLVRTVAGGGESYYFRGDHRATVPALWRALRDT